MDKPAPAGVQYLSKCPGCSYDLRGLPDKHKCPECGLSYNRKVEVIRCSRISWVILIFLLFMCTFAVVELTLSLSGSGRSVYMPLFVIVVLGRLLVKNLFSTRRAVLSADGVRFLGYKYDEQLARWQDVEKVVWSGMRGSIYIWSKEGEKIMDLKPDFFGTTERADEFVAAAQRWLADYNDREGDFCE